MRPVKTRPRFRCDFCRFTATAPTVEKHERICWMNPDRHCPTCNDTGNVEWREDIYDARYPCPYCSQRNPEIKAAS